MRIQNSFNYNPTSRSRFSQKYITSVTQKTKQTFVQLDKKSGFMSTPIKYYIIGLAIPIPFASTVGLIIGLGVAAGKKILKSIKHNHTS